ncbi:MAG: hypothetical protein NDI61_10365 [Bdellovibrionaceae bacterium]|nr:hypothetical protein [Pseudobdellovibrionaceae bacterium]
MNALLLNSIRLIRGDTHLWRTLLDRFLMTVLGVFLTVSPAHALWSSPRPVHPIGWMHQLPVGEAPGWLSPHWTDVDFSWSNIWNTPLTVYNSQNGRELTYSADFEQRTTIIEKGFALNDWLALAVELAYAHRDGGVFDRLIDDFHVTIDSDRFRRYEFPNNLSRFQITTDGTDKLISNSASGLSSYKFKLKFWPARWTDTNWNCPCGIGFSLQAKFPIGDPRRGLTSGDIDVSGLAHIGVPLGWDSAFLLTTGLTALGRNPTLDDWPRKRVQFMIDGLADLNLWGGFGLILQATSQSPLIDLTPLEIRDPDRSDPLYKEKRLSSGWNSLVLWRVYESIGFRYNFDGGARWTLTFTEDIGINDYDEVDDYVYVNGAPDFLLTTQLQIPF